MDGAPGLPALVTVAFEASMPLVRLQASSLASHVATGIFAKIIVIDNTAKGIGAGERRRLLTVCGDHAGIVEVQTGPSEMLSRRTSVTVLYQDIGDSSASLGGDTSRPVKVRRWLPMNPSTLLSALRSPTGLTTLLGAW